MAGNSTWGVFYARDGIHHHSLHESPEVASRRWTVVVVPVLAYRLRITISSPRFSTTKSGSRTNNVASD